MRGRKVAFSQECEAPEQRAARFVGMKLQAAAGVPDRFVPVIPVKGEFGLVRQENDRGRVERQGLFEFVSGFLQPATDLVNVVHPMVSPTGSRAQRDSLAALAFGMVEVPIVREVNSGERG